MSCIPDTGKESSDFRNITTFILIKPVYGKKYLQSILVLIDQLPESFSQTCEGPGPELGFRRFISRRPAVDAGPFARENYW
jgi:hypothetical protein